MDELRLYQTLGRIEKAVEKLEESTTSLDIKVEALEGWRNRILGMATAIATVVSVVCTLAFRWLI